MSLPSALSGETYTTVVTSSSGVAGRPSTPASIRRLIAHRNAASVFPDPVGAAISVSSPEAICFQPALCGAVGLPKRPVNQRVTSGWNNSVSVMVLCGESQAKTIAVLLRRANTLAREQIVANG